MKVPADCCQEVHGSDMNQFQEMNPFLVPRLIFALDFSCIGLPYTFLPRTATTRSARTASRRSLGPTAARRTGTQRLGS